MNEIVDREKQATLREKVYAAEKVMIEAIKNRELPAVPLEVTHYFSEGLYARKLVIPKGAVVTGKIHKHENMNIMSRGDMSVLTEDGIVRVQAGFHVTSPPGTKRIVYAHEDSVWTTIHATEETDLAKIESYFVAQDEAEYLAYCETLQLEGA